MTVFPIVQTEDDVSRQVLSDHPDLMVVLFRFDAVGAIGAMHSHIHVQSTYVHSGRFLFSINGIEQEYGPGDSFIVPSNVEHGCVCLEAGKLVDTFTPRRDDFL